LLFAGAGALPIPKNAFLRGGSGGHPYKLIFKDGSPPDLIKKKTITTSWQPLLPMRGHDDRAHTVLERTSNTPVEAHAQFDDIKRAMTALVGGARVWREL